MYNFRYHLVTIISIFAALVIGLLLGVTITGSDLVRDASSNLAQSLVENFDELNQENETLSDQLQVRELLSDELFSAWQSKRLKGRTIVVLTRSVDSSDTLTTALNALITRSGGIPVTVRINSSRGFTLEDEQMTTELKRILPETDGEAYEETLARALVDEWSFTARDSQGSVIAAFEANYPLTTWLVEKKLISVTVAYKSLLDVFGTGTFSGAATLSTQHFAYELADDLQLPYGVNGVIDTAVSSAVEGAPAVADSVALQIALRFDQKGLTGELPYFDIDAELAAQAVAETDAEATGEMTDETANEAVNETQDNPLSANPFTATQVSASANYYALLLQEGEGAEAMRAFAQDNDLSCVFLPLDTTGRYGVVALLSGAEKGVYGFNLTGGTSVPPAPTDLRGNAAFVKAPS
jgi:hypothetical protein